jgi:hypothetical protein
MTEAAHAFFDRPIPGAPAGTPAWLTRAAWHEAVSLGDLHPQKIAITLGVVDRYDRVWMRGHFTCNDCNGLGASRPVH